MNGVAVLALAQMLAASGLTVVMLFGTIVGAQMAPRPALATVSISLAIVAMALTTVPAALLMRRTGRRAGFIAGALVGVLGGVVTAYGVSSTSFSIFCVGSMLLGCSMAFTQQYRFAAAECVAPEHVSRAVSFVLLGSLGAAIIGPQLALAARDLINDAPYAGSFLSISVLYLLAIAVLSRLRLPPAALATQAGEDLPASALLARPDFRLAVSASLVAFVVMSFIMTAAPLSMHTTHHHSVDSTTWVLQSHVLAMYLPSLFAGHALQRFGIRAMMIAGSVLLALCTLVSLIGHDVMHYWWGLVLLGIGWSLLFVAGTTLLSRNFRGPSRHRAQAINEFAVFGSQACASLLAGLAVQHLGWQLLNLVTLPALAFIIIAASRFQDRAPASAGNDAQVTG